MAGIPAVVVWVTSAPHPRLVYGVLWACAAATVTATGGPCLTRTEGRPRALFLAILFALSSFPAVHRVAAWVWRGEPERAIEALLLPAGTDHGFHPTRQMKAAHCVTASGLSVIIPVGDDKIWDAPLPAAAYCEQRLAARRPGDLGKGFRLRQ